MRMFLSIVAIMILAVGIAVGFFGHYAVMTIAFLGFVVCFFGANLDRISEFKATGSGVEAKTREVLDRAENTLHELQLLATRIAELSLSLVKRTGRGDFSESEEESIKVDILSVLRQLNIPEVEVQATLKGWHGVVEFDYAYFILGQGAPDGINSETRQAWDALRGGGITNRPSPDAIESFVSEHNLNSPERREYITDYRHYLTHRKHRRPDAWDNRRTWGNLRLLNKNDSG